MTPHSSHDPSAAPSTPPSPAPATPVAPASKPSVAVPPPMVVPLIEDDPPFNPVAMFLAFLFPGAGHAYLGEMRRARLIATGVLGMFFGGMFIGGVDVVDRREDFVWFLGQALVGPVAFGTDYVHQNMLKVAEPGSPRRSAHPNEIRDPRTRRPIQVRDPETGEALPFNDPRTGQTRLSTPSDRPPNTKSLGRVNEIGTLFCTLAGMLNLICIIDAAKRHPAPARRKA